MNLTPARLAPVFVPRIWGSHDLAPLFETPAGAKAAGAEPIGEVWLTGDRCRFASGPWTGRELAEAWPALPVDWTGRCFQGAARIPLLVKFIFPDDKLSVQVHPNDDYARKNEAAAGGVGKTEMWYAVAARPGAELRLGLEPDVTKESFERAIADGTAERCLSAVPVHAGDTFFVPAGTAHTIGPGMVLCEVQQNSDITYRVFDYNRLGHDGSPRPLHILQALDVMTFGEQKGRRTEPVEVRTGPLLRTYLAACSHFVTERWEFSGPVDAATSLERFELLITLSGNGRIEWAGESCAYGPVEVWLLPAALGSYRLTPAAPTTLLRTYVPDLREFSREVAAQNVAEDAVSRLVHR